MRSDSPQLLIALRYIALVSLVACGVLSIIATGGGGGGTLPPSNDADLADLVLPGVALDQIFQSVQTDYTATVSPLISTTTVIPTPSDAKATISVNGAGVGAGMPSAKITLEYGSNTIMVVVTAEDGVTTTAYVIDVTRKIAASLAQRAYIKASNTEAFDSFGDAIALDGDTLAVAASDEDSIATGVNKGQANNLAPGAGAVYVFTRDGSGVWSQQAYIKASNTDTAGGSFGSLSIAIDGNTLAVAAAFENSLATGVDGDQTDSSAPGAGAVYVFTRDGSGVWSQQAYIKASNTDEGDNFGSLLDLDGDTLAVGADGEDSNATGVNGDQDDNIASGAGAVYVFTRDGNGVWSQQAYIKASNVEQVDVFGFSVALDGDTLAVGAFGEDSNARGIDGNQASNSDPNSGAVYVFD